MFVTVSALLLLLLLLYFVIVVVVDVPNDVVVVGIVVALAVFGVIALTHGLMVGFPLPFPPVLRTVISGGSFTWCL